MPPPFYPQKKGNPTMDVKGLKISDIINIDLDAFNKLNESELRHLTSRLVSASNKRIRRLEKHQINSPAYRQLGTDKAFSTKLPKGTSKQQRVNKLRSEFARARGFLTAETSTIGGYRSFVDRTEQRIADELDIPKNTVHAKLDVDRLFDTLHDAQKKGLIISYRGSDGSVQARNFIAEKLIEKPDIGSEELMDWLKGKMDAYYEKKQQEEIEDETEEFEDDEEW